MRALVLLIVFLVGYSTFEQQPKEITNSSRSILPNNTTTTVTKNTTHVRTSLQEYP
jgi:hypothetical protein